MSNKEISLETRCRISREDFINRWNEQWRTAMSNTEISLETRASSAFVQGRLTEVVANHRLCCLGGCSWMGDIYQVVTEWKQAEAELQALKATTLASRSEWAK